MTRIACLAAALALVAAPLVPVPAEAGGTILTISGEVSNSNRGPLDPFMDGFLDYHGKTFERAFEMDQQALAALPQQTVTANAEGWPSALTMEGPLLADVLEAAGATGRPIVVYALDGYGFAYSGDEIAARDRVLAMSANGQPLGIGGRGPLWLVHETGDAGISADEEAGWVWSVFHIEVE